VRYCDVVLTSTVLCGVTLYLPVCERVGARLDGADSVAAPAQ